MTEASIKEELHDTSEEYQALVHEHREYEEKLESIQGKDLLTPEDEFEIKRIKLHKLTLKDRMQSLLSSAAPN